MDPYPDIAGLRAAETFRGPLASMFERQCGAALGALADVLPSLLRHPAESLPVAPASDRSAWPGAADTATAAAILERADADLGLPWPQPRAHDAARVHSDGDRDVWEQAAYARQRRLSRATVSTRSTCRRSAPRSRSRTACTSAGRGT